MSRSSYDGPAPDALGPLLAALYRAPMCSGLHQWLDPAAWRKLWDRPRQGSVSVSLVAGRADTAPHDTAVNVWVDAEGCTRVDHGDVITVESADESIQYHPLRGAIRHPRREHVGIKFPHWLWRPRPLLAALDVQAIVEGEASDRATWRVTAATAAHPTVGMPVEVAPQGKHFEFDVDQHTGVVLAFSSSLVDGAPVTEIEWTEFEPDADVPAEVFDAAIPPDVPLQSPTDIDPERAARLAVSTPERRAKQ